MEIISRLERWQHLDPFVSAGQRVARGLPPGKVRDVLHGVWLGHPLHPMLVQAATGAWISAGILDATGVGDPAAGLLVAGGLLAAVPAAAAGAADWSEQHEQQLRVGVVHALANTVAVGCYSSSLLVRGRRARRALRACGLAAAGAGGLLGGHLSFRLAGGANHAEAVPHLIRPGWQYLMIAADLPEGKPVRQLLGEVPVVAVRADGLIHVLADRCSHLSGPLSDGELSQGCLTCPWHGSRFRLADGSVARGPATAPQPVFEVREAGGAIQVRLPGAG
jgi:nitrite reductase/ring-hydroxylating ferredoxin subunit